MYIQLTTRCNMKCDHCCFSCTEKGIDISRDNLIKACELAYELGEEYITLGGGEPTLHPLLFDFIGICVGEYDLHIQVITNGKDTKRAIALAKMGYISTSLSRDQYHESIDKSVVDAFGYDRTRGYVEALYNQGRARKIYCPKKTGCVCPDLFISPDGKIFACGHRNMQFGTLDSPEIPIDYFDLDERCSIEYKKALKKVSV